MIIQHVKRCSNFTPHVVELAHAQKSAIWRVQCVGEIWEINGIFFKGIIFHEENDGSIMFFLQNHKK